MKLAMNPTEAERLTALEAALLEFSRASNTPMSIPDALRDYESSYTNLAQQFDAFKEHRPGPQGDGPPQTAQQLLDKINGTVKAYEDQGSKISNPAWLQVWTNGVLATYQAEYDRQVAQTGVKP